MSISADTFALLASAERDVKPSYDADTEYCVRRWLRILLFLGGNIHHLEERQRFYENTTILVTIERYTGDGKGYRAYTNDPKGVRAQDRQRSRHFLDVLRKCNVTYRRVFSTRQACGERFHYGDHMYTHYILVGINPPG